MPEKTNKSYIVVVSDNALKDINRLAAQMTEMGFAVNRVLPISGVISGVCSLEIAIMTSKLAGVEAVEEEAIAKVDPPETGGIS